MLEYVLDRFLAERPWEISQGRNVGSGRVLGYALCTVFSLYWICWIRGFVIEKGCEISEVFMCVGSWWSRILFVGLSSQGREYGI